MSSSFRLTEKEWKDKYLPYLNEKFPCMDLSSNKRPYEIINSIMELEKDRWDFQSLLIDLSAYSKFDKDTWHIDVVYIEDFLRNTYGWNIKIGKDCSFITDLKRGIYSRVSIFSRKKSRIGAFTFYDSRDEGVGLSKGDLKKGDEFFEKYVYNQMKDYLLDISICLSGSNVSIFCLDRNNVLNSLSFDISDMYNIDDFSDMGILNNFLGKKGFITKKSPDVVSMEIVKVSKGKGVFKK